MYFTKNAQDRTFSTHNSRRLAHNHTCLNAQMFYQHIILNHLKFKEDNLFITRYPCTAN